MTGCGRAWELVRARGAAAQLCVLRDGEVLLDDATGCPPDDLFWIFSASKPYVALLVHRLAERGDDALLRSELLDPLGLADTHLLLVPGHDGARHLSHVADAVLGAARSVPEPFSVPFRGDRPS